MLDFQTRKWTPICAKLPNEVCLQQNDPSKEKEKMPYDP
jgi:hypothetical protein